MLLVNAEESFRMLSPEASDFGFGSANKHVAFYSPTLLPNPGSTLTLTVCMLFCRRRASSPPVLYANQRTTLEGTEAHREERPRHPDPCSIGTRAIGHAGVGLLPNARPHHSPCHADISIRPLQPDPGAPGATPTAVIRKCPA